MTTRLLFAAGLVAISQIMVIRIDKEPQPADMPKLGTTSLPTIVGDYTGHDEPLDDRLTAATQADAMLNRIFRNRLGDTVIANLAVWTQYQLGIPHSPEECYPNAGWEIVSRELKTITGPAAN